MWEPSCDSIPHDRDSSSTFSRRATHWHHPSNLLSNDSFFTSGVRTSGEPSTSHSVSSYLLDTHLRTRGTESSSAAPTEETSGSSVRWRRYLVSRQFDRHSTFSASPISTTQYETARSPSIVSFTSLLSIPLLYETAEMCPTDSEATRSVSSDFVTAKASARAELVSNHTTAMTHTHSDYLSRG